ncbi:MAG: HAMP domain-containing protein [Acidobacteria bacterium]|nr:HAMP domain-containing protein [Acidobacteriota bacterium]
MALRLRETPARPKPVAPPPRRSAAPPRRRPFRDNTRLLLAGIAVLVAALVSLLALASRSATLAPDFLTEVVLYALSATNLTILVALGFVLARNIVKLLVEKRRALPFAHFRAKLVAVLLGMTLVPAVLVLLVGSELIRNSVDRWFNAPMDDVLSSANAIAGDYYQERQRLVGAEAERLARALGGLDLASSPAAAVRAVVAQDVEQQRLGRVDVYRLESAAGVERPLLIPVVDVRNPSLPAPPTSGSTLRLAEQAAGGGDTTPSVQQLPDGGDLIQTAIAIPSSGNARPQGVIVASEYIASAFATRARRMTQAYEDYQQLRVLKQPLAGVYLSFFLMLTLMILVAATWMGLYIAKRITRPVQMLAAAANEIGAGHLDHRVEPETRDEFGSLIEAFNRMASDLSTSRRRLERSSIELEHKHRDVEARRRYVETILERIATGVVSVDTGGRVRTLNSAAARLLGLAATVCGLPVQSAFGSPELRPLAILIDEAARSREEALPQEVAIVRDGRELHLAVMTTPLRREDGVSDGLVLVIDDVTPLIRAQKVAAWREVARRLAHEIKNPLTPIQLCAERLRRHFTGAPEQTRALVDECTGTIVGEVESLKGLVDEFSQFARMPAPRAMATDLHALLTDVLGLYRGILTDVELRPRFAEQLPRVSVDPEQIRRVLINLIDNAVEAMEQRGVIDIETHHAPAENLVRIVVADDGPGISASEREKLFLPYYSTKKRGSGLGLAIVRRIVAEHGGSIDVTDNTPRGTRFAIELPC